MKKITTLLLLMLPSFIYTQNENLIPYQCQEKWGYCDEQAYEIIKPKYDFAQFFVNERAIVGFENKYGMIDKTGIEILSCEYDEVKNYDKKNDLILVRKNKKWLQFDSKGNRIYKNAIYASSMYDCVNQNEVSGYPELYLYKENNKYGFVSYKCNDTQNDSCKIYGKLSFDNYQEIGLTNVAMKYLNTWKIYNYLGKQINSQAYNWIDSVAINRHRTSYYKVKKNNKFGLINSDGEEIIKPEYDQLHVINEIYNFSENWYHHNELFFMVVKDNHNYYINQNGTEYTCSEK